MLIKRLSVILIIIFLYLLQSSFFSATNLFLFSINFLIILVIWLSYIGSRWSLFVGLISGLLMDIQFSLIGVNLLSFLILVSFAYFFKKKFITSDRFFYFVLMIFFSLSLFVSIQFLLCWIFIGLFEGWSLINRSEINALFSFNNIWQFVFINFLFLNFFYVFLRKQFSLNPWYEKSA